MVLAIIFLVLYLKNYNNIYGGVIVEKETIDYLVTQFNTIIDQYQSIEVLKEDLKEYNTFMANSFETVSYFSEYLQIREKYYQYLDLYHYQDHQFSKFQKDLIKTSLFNGFSFKDIHEFALPNLSDEEMDVLYHSCYR